MEHVLSLLGEAFCPGKTVDLGSGDGRIVRTVCGDIFAITFSVSAPSVSFDLTLWAHRLAAHRCGLCPAVGYELNPLAGTGALRAWRAGCAGSVRYHREDLWKATQGALDPLIAHACSPRFQFCAWCLCQPGRLGLGLGSCGDSMPTKPLSQLGVTSLPAGEPEGLLQCVCVPGS